MESFIGKPAVQIIGLISGFDRLVFRGVLRTLSYVGSMMMYLGVVGVQPKDFTEHALSMTNRIKEASLEVAKISNRPVIYLPSSQTSKEDMACGIAAKDGIATGLVCVLTSVEPCLSYDILRNRETKRLELQPLRRKCFPNGTSNIQDPEYNPSGSMTRQRSDIREGPASTQEP